jgi:colanic acid biosynthesis glycosyl transferase WcaI
VNRDSRLNVLILSSNYWPEEVGIGPYTTGLAEYLQDRGHDVVVATAFPHYPQWQSSAHWRVGTSETRAGVTIRRRWHYVPHKQSAAHRALFEGSLFGLGLTALPLRRRPDVVVGVCPSLAAGMLAATASMLHRVPYGIVFQDLVGRAAEQSGVSGGERVARAVEGVEVRLARRAAAIAIIAEGFATYLEEGGVAPEKITRLRNWTRRVAPTASREQTRARLGWAADEFVCLHGGNMGLKQGLDNLLDAASLLRDDAVRIVLAGDGSDRARLEARAKALELDDAEFMDLQPPGRWEELMEASDVLLVNQRPSVADMSLPSKLTSYFAAGRAIVAAVSPASETAREIEAAGGGDVVPASDPSALRRAVLALKHDPARRAELGAGGRRYAEDVLSADRILADYEQFLYSLAKLDGQERMIHA